MIVDINSLDWLSLKFCNTVIWGQWTIPENCYQREARHEQASGGSDSSHVWKWLHGKSVTLLEWRGEKLNLFCRTPREATSCRLPDTLEVSEDKFNSLQSITLLALQVTV